MKVLHILDHSVPLFSGYSFRSRGIIHAQRRLGLTPVVLTSPKHKGKFSEVEEIEGIRYYRIVASATDIPFVRELKLMACLRQRIDAVAKLEKVDLIHSHSPLLNGLPALGVARRRKIPLIYEARAFWEDAAVDRGTFTESSFRYRLSRALETFLFKHADCTITICEAMRREVELRGIGSNRVSVIPNGVDTEQFGPRERSAELAKRFGLNGGPIFGFIGSFYHYEGLRFLVEAFPLIRKEIPEARLMLVGGGEEESELKASAGARDGVVFTGPVPHQEIINYYSLIDVFVCPRLRMRLTELVTPLKPLEAMAMGKAVLASNVGGHRELIENERTGLLFAPENREELIRQAVRLAGDSELRQKLGNAGRRLVTSERSWYKLARRYLEIYKELVVTGHHPAVEPIVGSDSVA